MQSPQDGRIKIRLTYDWERLEAPTEMTNLFDRPNDGGGVLHASWLPAQDSAWTAYRVYVWDSTFEPEWEPAKELTQTSLSAPQVYSEDDITIRIGGNVTFTCTIVMLSRFVCCPSR